MKKFYSILLAIFGFSPQTYASCYEQLKVANFCKGDTSVESEYDVCADLAELKLLTLLHASASDEEKIEISMRGKLIVERLKELGCGNILRATLVCAVCGDGKAR